MVRRERKTWPGLVAALAVVVGLLSVGAASAGAPAGELIPSLNGQGPNEREALLAVSRTRGGAEEVVLSERIKANGGLRRGDIIRAAAELQLTTTCVLPEPRCIGRRYDFSPLMEARIVIASNAEATGGRAAKRISDTVTRRCEQRRPNRNHHCVLPIGNAIKRVRSVPNLPCRPNACFVNMVAGASHPNARGGEVVVVGADTPEGEVRPDKARIDAFVERGDVPRPERIEGGRRISRRVPIAPERNAGRKVATSLELKGAQKGDVMMITATQVMSLGRLPYNSFVGTRMIIASKPNVTKTSGYASQVTRLGGEITELNGFNCTRGASEYRTPCTTRKVAIAEIRKDLPQSGGKPKPLYVNLVVSGTPKLAKAAPNDHMNVGAGRIRIERYRVAE